MKNALSERQVMDDDEDEERPTLRHRRNTFCSERYSFNEQQEKESDRIVFCSPILRTLRGRRPKCCDAANTPPSSPPTLNSFNDMGHLSRRVFNDTSGESHLSSSDFENSFGYRQMFDDKHAVTAITAKTIASCVATFLLKLITVGEKMAQDGHVNSSKYNIFNCSSSGGKNYEEKSYHYSITSLDVDIEQIPMTNLSKQDPIIARPPSSPTQEQVADFISRLCHEAKMEYECIVISLIYVRRLVKTAKGKLVLLKDNWKGIILSCVVLSNKVWDDFHMTNSDYCHMFKGLTIERVNALESQMFKALDHCCNVSPSLYAQTHFEIQALITSTTIENGRIRKPKDKLFSAPKIHTWIKDNISFERINSKTFSPLTTTKKDKGKGKKMSFKDKFSSRTKIYIMDDDSGNKITTTISSSSNQHDGDIENSFEKKKSSSKSRVKQFVNFWTNIFSNASHSKNKNPNSKRRASKIKSV